jgi:polyisoprenoid-binding protein YceI
MQTTEAVKTKMTIDPMNSEIQFKVKHLMISTLSGLFKKFNGSASTYSKNFEDMEIQFSMDVDSITTEQQMRDNHLKGPEFFDAEKFPRINFQSLSFKKLKGDDYLLVGNLTIKETTKQVEVNVIFGGTAKDSFGNIKVGFEITGIVNRKEFGLTYNHLTEAGGLAISEDVKLIANIQLIKEAIA